MASYFLQMFKRGGYISRRPLGADDTDEGKPEREERERFAVAAIAFCIEHNNEFKQHFLDVVANLSPECIEEVMPEPKLHTDLVLEGDRHVLVLEFKIDASLEPHQNPAEPEFWQEKGYGTKILETFSHAANDGKELRYIVIRRDFDGSRCASLQPRKGERLHCSCVPWRKLLLKGRDENKLEKDLYDCLGHLGAPISPYRHMKTKPKYTDEAKQGMAVYAFLEKVLSDVELLPGIAESDGKTL